MVRTKLICGLLLGAAAPAQEVRVRLFANTALTAVVAGGTRYEQTNLNGRVIPLRTGTVVRAGRSTLTLAGPATLRARPESLELIVRLPMEEFVAAALAGEVGGVREAEALKAMAVAARSYARSEIGRHKSEGYDFCDTTHCQDIRWPVAAPVRAAVEATSGEMLWYQGKAARTHYHADCGGRTEAAGAVWPYSGKPYLVSRDDSQFHPDRDWHAALSYEDLARVLGLKSLHQLFVQSRTPSGRAFTLLADGAPVSAERLHLSAGRILGWGLLRSKWYSLDDSGEKVLFTGRGAGHGVGLCQMGSVARARAGQDYRTILATYFPGTKLGLTSDGLAWQKRATERTDLWICQGGESLAAPLDHAVAAAEARAGWPLTYRPAVRVYPTVATYRDSTGEPGFVAASTRGRSVRLQPEGVLRSSGELDSILLHEALHLLVNARARKPVPVWFEEGLTEYLAEPQRPPKQWTPAGLKLLETARDQAELRRGYEEARSRVAALVRDKGLKTVTSWLETGLPAQ